MCFGKVPNKDIVKAFDVSLILYAEHSFNVSTFTARTITSSLSDIHGAITGAIASLKGPLHGGANEAVMHMMKEIGKPEKAKAWIENALIKKGSNGIWAQSLPYRRLESTNNETLYGSNSTIINLVYFFDNEEARHGVWRYSAGVCSWHLARPNENGTYTIWRFIIIFDCMGCISNYKWI